VSQLIQLSASNSTDEHALEGVCGTEDKHYFVDINFAVYGADAETYSQFAKKTRQEYHFLDDSAYKSLRLKVTVEKPASVIRCFCANSFSTTGAKIPDACWLTHLLVENVIQTSQKYSSR